MGWGTGRRPTIQWLTAPLLTPRASAASAWVRKSLMSRFLKPLGIPIVHTFHGSLQLSID